MKTYFFKFFTLVLLCIIVLCSCTNNKNINATLDETNEITKTLDSKATSSNSTSIESSNDKSTSSNSTSIESSNDSSDEIKSK